jgi:hypothetical protein
MDVHEPQAWKSMITCSLQKAKCTSWCLQEPAKADLLAFEAGGPAPQRQGFAILQTPPSSAVYEVTLALQPDGSSAVCSWEEVREPSVPAAAAAHC